MPRARLRARFMVSGPSIFDDGAILIGDDGRIAAIGMGDSVPEPPGCPLHDYGDAVIFPGLTNAHTHLELTGLNGGRALDEPHFPAWIRRLRELKAQRTYDDFLAAAREGIRQCFRQGVTTIADTGDTGAVPQAMAELGMRGIYYQEVFGPDPVLVRESMRALEAAMDSLERWRSDRITIGVSPHAPYTVSGPLYREVARWARRRSLSVAVHIAESAEESALLATGTGAFADAWRRRNLPMPEPLGLTPVSFLAQWGLWSPDGSEHDLEATDTLAIHAIRVPPDDANIMAAAEATVAWCPLANEAHGHGQAPVDDYWDLGILLGIGTDSELSVGPIDLLAAGRAAVGLHASRSRSVAELLAFAAVHLPGVLRLEGHPAGMLIESAPADLAVFPCPPGIEPVEALLQPGLGQALATWARGTLVHWQEGSELGFPSTGFLPR